MRNIALTDITLLSGVSVVIFTFLFRALFLRLRHTVNFRWSKRKNQLLLKYPENDNDPLQGCSRAYFSVCDANYLHEAPNKKSFLLVRFTSTFESFIIPLNRKVSEILLCYTEGTASLYFVYVRVTNCPNNYSFLGRLRSVRQIRGVNNALDVALLASNHAAKEAET